MGAETFYTETDGKNAEEAFQAAREKAQYDYGHAGYTGTIAEKDSFVHLGTVASEEAAREMAQQMIRKRDPRVDDKWGPAGCIEWKDVTGYSSNFLFFGWGILVTVKIKLSDGTSIECDTPEEASRFMQAQTKMCGQNGCRETNTSPHCGACGYHHLGMC